MRPITTMTGRLACACNLAYEDKNGHVPGGNANRDDYFSAGALTADPVNISDATEINVCRIWDLGETVVAAFRGTQPPLPNTNPLRNLQILADWVQNLNIRLVDAPWLAANSAGARLHGGFSSAIDSIWPDVFETLEAMSRIPGKTRFIFTGHSKGGAMATIAALRWVFETPPSQTIEVVTFGAPRAGNEAFAEVYARQNRITHSRIEFGLDIVPHLPLTSLTLGTLLSEITPGQFDTDLPQDYAHVGALTYFDGAGRSIPDSATLVTERLGFLIAALPFSPQLILTDHFIWSTGGQPGYLTSVSPGGYWG